MQRFHCLLYDQHYSHQIVTAPKEILIQPIFLKETLMSTHKTVRMLVCQKMKNLLFC